jgi:NAD(P)-dependent dehydrogenase (short-subunit alcohol dehydrogenase family)
VTLAARTTKEVADAAAAIRTRGEKAEAVTLDVTDLAAVQAFIVKAEPFDVLINNAGTNRPKMLMDVTIEDFDVVMGLNVRAAYFVAQAARSSTFPRRWGTSAQHGAASIARQSMRWRASPRRWPSSSPRTTSASTAWVRHSSRRR